MKNISAIILVFISLVAFGQKKNYPKKDFISPVNHKITLSGNFGELRGNHFHSGIDIKTGGVIGKKINAVAKGYISRIKVSANGFGKAIYIRHENGYTTVYGHLHEFNQVLGTWVKEQQYAKKSFEVDLYPRVNQFVVEQGEVIGLSGNTGGSGGPHLHFEVRDTKTEKPLNPLFFGFEIKDYIRPKITGLKIYPMNNRSLVNGSNNEWEFETEGWGEVHRLKRKDPIEVSGEIGFAVKTFDLLNDSHNKNGVYSVELMIDSSIVYSHQMESFAFSESKYINSLIDYAHYVDHKERYQRSVVDEGNKLSVVQEVNNEGIYSFTDTLIHELIYEIKDVYGNVSRLTCKLKSTKPVSEIVNEEEEADHWFNYAEKNCFEDEGLKLCFNAKTFYKSFAFDFSKENVKEGMYADIFNIHHKQTPVHKPYKISLKAESIPENLISKALIVNLNDEEPNPHGGSYKDGYIKTYVRTLGAFTVMLDTVPPTIKGLNIHQGKKINGYKKITFKIKDDLSGIKSYRGTLNGNWVLMEYDPKIECLFYLVDERMKKGKNKFSLTVTDDRGNKSEYKAEVYF